jgi:hypothetical protein
MTANNLAFNIINTTMQRHEIVPLPRDRHDFRRFVVRLAEIAAIASVMGAGYAWLVVTP